MADGFDQLDAFLGSAVAALAPAARRALFREIIREIRKRNQARITRQVGPEGEAWAPRKRNGDGRVRSTAKMLTGLRAARRLALTADADGATAGYRGRTARIAAVHHFGRVDQVAPDGPTARYAARPLLGLPAQDVEWIRRRLIDHIADALD